MHCWLQGAVLFLADDEHRRMISYLHTYILPAIRETPGIHNILHMKEAIVFWSHHKEEADQPIYISYILYIYMEYTVAWSG